MELRGVDKTSVVTHNLFTYYTSYCVCMITGGRNLGAAAEADPIREKQLK